MIFSLHFRGERQYVTYSITAASLMTSHSHVMLEDSPSPVKGLQREMIFTIPPFQEDYLGSKNLQFALKRRSYVRFLKKPNFLISWVRIRATFANIEKAISREQKEELSLQSQRQEKRAYSLFSYCVCFFLLIFLSNTFYDLRIFEVNFM